MPTLESPQRVFARERLTVTNATPKVLTASLYNQSASPVGGNQAGVFKRRATSALVMVESGSGAIHFTVDGTTPTTGLTVADVGMAAQALDTIPLDTYQAVAGFKALAESTDAIIEVWYLR